MLCVILTHLIVSTCLFLLPPSIEAGISIEEGDGGRIAAVRVNGEIWLVELDGSNYCILQYKIYSTVQVGLYIRM